jgi:hypothetical protein
MNLEVTRPKGRIGLLHGIVARDGAIGFDINAPWRVRPHLRAYQALRHESFSAVRLQEAEELFADLLCLGLTPARTYRRRGELPLRISFSGFFL